VCHELRNFLRIRQKINWRVYTGNVIKRVTLCCLILAFVVCAALARQGAAAEQAMPQPATVIPRLTCAAASEQSYALYLPSQYSPAKRWPIIYTFDPLARGNVPVERMKEAAERYGFIVVGSNNSRNGPWKVEIDAAQAMSDDTHTRFSIDDRRVYFAGFSGGARVASHIAQVCKCAAGVLLNSAGFPVGRPPTRDSTFAVFATVGDLDFNYPEVTRLDQTLGQFGFPHALRYFDGPHEWAPTAVMEQALAWFRVIAIKESREPRDESFVATQREAFAARAHAAEQSGDLYIALRQYREAAAAFEGLADVGAFQREASKLVGQKLVWDAERRHQQELEQQEVLTNNISASLRSLRQASADRAGEQRETERQIIDLRERASHEKRPDKARVLHRAIADVFAQALEGGLGRLADKDPLTAKDYFRLALAAQPDSIWALRSLATACALTGDRKSAFQALRREKAKTQDHAGFAAWVAAEPAFTRFRNDRELRTLLDNR
jgi:tetratricopeptide (TPR) repeat protein